MPTAKATIGSDVNVYGKRTKSQKAHFERLGALREKALGAAKRQPVNVPLPKPKPYKAKKKPSLIWSAERYKEGQRQK